MHMRLAVSWWSLVLRGLVAIIFGVLAFLVPGIALQSLILVFGAFALIDGVFAIASGIRPHGAQGRDWLLVIGGIAGVVIGVYAFVEPDLTAIALVYVIGAWAIVTGAFELGAALRLRATLSHAWILAAEGILSVLFGVVLWVAPGAGALALIWVIAAYAVIAGIMFIVLGLRLRSMAESSGPTPPPMTRAPAR